MLADPEMQVAAEPVLGAVIAGALEGHAGLGRGREVGGAADQPRNIRRDLVEDLAGRVAAGDALRIGREYRDVLVPAGGELALLDGLALCGELRVLGLVAGEQRLPVGARFLAARAEIGGEILVHAVRYQELRVLGPAVVALGGFHFLDAERLAVDTGGVLLVR